LFLLNYDKQNEEKALFSQKKEKIMCEKNVFKGIIIIFAHNII